MRRKISHPLGGQGRVSLVKQLRQPAEQMNMALQLKPLTPNVHLILAMPLRVRP
jgi:hypothetical protein